MTGRNMNALSNRVLVYNRVSLPWSHREKKSLSMADAKPKGKRGKRNNNTSSDALESQEPTMGAEIEDAMDPNACCSVICPRGCCAEAKDGNSCWSKFKDAWMKAWSLDGVDSCALLSQRMVFILVHIPALATVVWFLRDYAVREVYDGADQVIYRFIPMLFTLGIYSAFAWRERTITYERSRVRAAEEMKSKQKKGDKEPTAAENLKALDAAAQRFWDPAPATSLLLGSLSFFVGILVFSVTRATWEDNFLEFGAYIFFFGGAAAFAFSILASKRFWNLDEPFSNQFSMWSSKRASPIAIRLFVIFTLLSAATGGVLHFIKLYGGKWGDWPWLYIYIGYLTPLSMYHFLLLGEVIHNWRTANLASVKKRYGDDMTVRQKRADFIINSIIGMAATALAIGGLLIVLFNADQPAWMERYWELHNWRLAAASALISGAVLFMMWFVTSELFFPKNGYTNMNQKSSVAMVAQPATAAYNESDT